MTKSRNSKFSKKILREILNFSILRFDLDSRIDVSGIKNFRKRFAVTNDPILIIINGIICRHENTMASRTLRNPNQSQYEPYGGFPGLPRS